MANIYKPLFDAVNSGVAILTAGKIHDSIPTIQDVGHDLPTDRPVEHAGYGLFTAKVGNDTVCFDGGGAMTRVGDVGNERFSWTRLSASRDQLDAMGYPMEDVRSAVIELMDGAKGARNG